MYSIKKTLHDLIHKTLLQKSNKLKNSEIVVLHDEISWEARPSIARHVFFFYNLARSDVSKARQKVKKKLARNPKRRRKKVE